MEVSFTFRNVESSEAMKNYAKEKVSRLQKYVRSPLHADVIFSHERHLHRVEIAVRGEGHRFSGTHESGDMYASASVDSSASGTSVSSVASLCMRSAERSTSTAPAGSCSRICS